MRKKKSDFNPGREYIEKAVTEYLQRGGVIKPFDPRPFDPNTPTGLDQFETDKGLITPPELHSLGVLI